LVDLMTYPSRFRGKCAWSTPFLKIRKGLVGAFGLHDDHPIPSRINEEVVRIRYWNTWNQYLGPASLMTIPSRSSSRRSDHEIRTMDPSNDVMIRSLRTVLLNNQESATTLGTTRYTMVGPAYVSVRTRSCSNCKFMAISSPQGLMSICTMGLLTMGPVRITRWK